MPWYWILILMVLCFCGGYFVRSRFDKKIEDIEQIVKS